MPQEIETCSIIFPDEVEEWLKSLQEPKKTDQKRVSKIQRVPRLLRDMEKNKSCYDPRVVSLGPYHHRKDELQDLEKLKPEIALQYMHRVQRKGEELYASVAKVSKEARKCYAEGSTESFNDVEFTRMMFLDACFVLGFLQKPRILEFTPHVAGLVRRDLFLLENQIPLLVLEALFHCAHEKEEQWSTLINDLLRSVRQPKMWNVPSIVSSDAVHLLELLRNDLVGEVKREKNDGNKSNWSSFRSASELKTVGIYFKPSKSHNFTDIHFCSRFGIGFLHLPQIIVDDNTKSMFLNLIAHENCPDNVSKNLQVTSYICFMDELIDQAEDVKELRSKGILLNVLGSDQQVAELFNEIANELVTNPDDYIGVKNKIERHYRNRITVWMAEWLHKHFSSPWTVLTFLGAFLALFLTVVQTYYQVFKS